MNVHSLSARLPPLLTKIAEVGRVKDSVVEGLSVTLSSVNKPETTEKALDSMGEVVSSRRDKEEKVTLCAVMINEGTAESDVMKRRDFFTVPVSVASGLTEYMLSAPVKVTDAASAMWLSPMRLIVKGVTQSSFAALLESAVLISWQGRSVHPHVDVSNPSVST